MRDVATMSVGLHAVPLHEQELSFELALERIAARASALDASPRFPAESFADLREAGIPQLAADRDCCDFAHEVAVVRALAAVDASTARILDGHFNGVERLALAGVGDLGERELQAVRYGELLLGVWGADPVPGEGAPASIHERAAGLTLRGTKVFCSGAGGVQRALVIARDERDRRRLAYVAVDTGTVRVRRDWYRAGGLRSSESHLVEFDDAPVLALLGGPDEIMREPWFSRDAVRTSATWAGLADAILSSTLDSVRALALDEVRLLALGRMRVARASIDRWLEHTVQRLRSSGERPNASDEEAAALAGECRIAIAHCARTLAAEGARICGSRTLAQGGALERSRRDLDVFLLQHRLDPRLVALGAATVEESSR